MEWYRALDRALCILYPRRCAGCGCLLPGGEFFCGDCKRAMERDFSPRFLEEGYQGGGLPVWEQDAPDGFSMEKGACFPYRGPLRKAILTFKFYRGRLLERELGGLLHRGFLRLFLDEPIDAIQPVPLYQGDLRRRGYNQAGLLAKELSRRTGIPVVEALEKERRTPKQHHLDARQRRENLRGVFRVPEGRLAAIQDRRILVVDDVTTTGSTLEECGRALFDAGAVRVYGLTLGAAVRAGVDPDYRGGKKSETGVTVDFADSGG